MKVLLSRLIYAGLAFAFLQLASAEEPATEKIKVGVMTSLTGGAEYLGTDAKNSLLFANKKFFNDKYELIFEDDQCSGKQGVAAANRLVNKHKVKYVLGTTCNEPLLVTAPIFNKSKVVAIGTTATTGDQEAVGDFIFRMFPSDTKAVDKIYPLIASSHKHLAMLTQQDAYTVMVERTFQKLNSEKKLIGKISSDFENRNDVDLRTSLLRLKNSGADAFFSNFPGDEGYIQSVKQARELGWTVPIYGLYFPGSETSIKALAKLNNDVIFANLPLIENALQGEGREIYQDFVAQYGQPVSISMGIVFGIESLRILDKAINSGQPVEKYLKQTTFPTMIGDIGFDEHGAVKGVEFQIQKIQDGKVVVLPQ